MSQEMMFWIGAAAMVAVALLFLLPPLLGRSREVGVARRETNLAIFQQRMEELQQDLESGAISESQYAQAEADLKRALLDDLEGEEEQAESDTGVGRTGALITLLLLPLLAFGIYSQIGSPDAIDVAVASERAEAQQGRAAFEQAVAQLEQKLEREPNNVEGWSMLAKSYQYLGRGDQVVGLYQRALSHFAERPDPQLLLEYGEALANAQQGSWAGEPLQQLQRALEVDPEHADTLWFSGHVHFDLGRYREALEYWQRLARIAPREDHEIIQMINQAAAKAQQQLGIAVAPLVEVAPTAALSVVVSLDPALQGRVVPEDVVFVYAKAAGRGGPPLAAQRLSVAELPATVRLDDSMAMIPGNNLSSVAEVVVGAKISKSGVATGGSGDLVGTVESSSSNPETIELVINRTME
jgi:cytochrome c-type biogenesis protein CcmH